MTRRTTAHRIKFADQRIREARQRIAALDRALSQQWKTLHALLPDDPTATELRAENVRLANERTKACIELMELLELEMTPRDEMGSA